MYFIEKGKIMYEIKEVKKDGKRFVQVTAEIVDTGKAPTAKGNVSCGGTGGNVKTAIQGPHNTPITCGLLMYASE